MSQKPPAQREQEILEVVQTTSSCIATLCVQVARGKVPPQNIKIHAEHIAKSMMSQIRLILDYEALEEGQKNARSNEIKKQRAIRKAAMRTLRDLPHDP